MNGLPVTLTADEMQQNFDKLLTLIRKFFPDRQDELLKMYSDFEDEIIMAPASGVEHFHNAFPGGYIEHVLRVADFSLSEYESWKALGLDVSTFTLSELIFVAIHHDLGKVGFPGKGNGRYIWNTSDWHRQNQGKIYESNLDVPFVTVPDLGLFLIQKYGISISWNEYLGIKIHDGLYEESNKPYYVAKRFKSSLRCNLPFIIHAADLKAAKFEYERWLKASGKTLENYRG